MSGAPHITVIEPDELKEIVTGFAEEVLSQYDIPAKENEH